MNQCVSPEASASTDASIHELGVSLCAFSGAQARGNNCQVVALEEPISQAQLQEYQQQACQLTGDAVLCITWPEPGDRQFSALCLQSSGRMIHCCGHGLLSIAGCWLAALDETAIYLTTPALSTDQANPPIRALRGDQAIWLEFPIISAETIEPPSWLGSVLATDSIPESACHFGKDTDYLLVHWPESVDLTSFERPEGLAEFTQRALIVTKVCEPGVIELRYFAPQYGVSEDAATGSALRCAAEFYAKTLGWKHLQCHQKSEQGGYLLAQVSEDVIRIGGYLTAAEPAEQK